MSAACECEEPGQVKGAGRVGHTHHIQQQPQAGQHPHHHSLQPVVILHNEKKNISKSL